MGAQLIEYTYSGDEAAWQKAIETFLAALAADPVLAKGITYQVYVRPDGRSRVHVPVWRDQEVLAHLQAQPFFRTFSESTKGFAGDTLNVTKPRLSS